MWFCPSYCLAGASPLPLDVGYLFLMGSNIVLSAVVQQRVVILEFSQKMRAHPASPFCSPINTPPSKGIQSYLLHSPIYTHTHTHTHTHTRVCSCSCCSVTKSCPILCAPWTAAHQAPLSFTISQSLRKLMSVESVMPSNHLILCRPLLLLPSVFPSIRVFSNQSALCIRWAKYWSFSINPSSEYSGLLSFRIDWFDLLAVQGTLKSLLQHHSSKASIRQGSAFFVIQLSYLYVTTGKNIALSI